MRAVALYTSGFVLTAILCWSSLLSSISLVQTSGLPSGDIKPTSGGTLDVKLEPIPSPIESGQETNYKVTFLQKGTGTIQVHVDYDFIILKDNTTEVFRASQQTGQPLLHTAEGIVTMPFS